MKRLAIYLLLVLLISIPSQGQTELILHSLFYSPDGEYVVGVGDHVVVWDATSNRIVETLTLNSQASDYKFPDSAWSPDGNRLAVAGIDDWIRVGAGRPEMRASCRLCRQRGVWVEDKPPTTPMTGSLVRKVPEMR